ncbi:hypothetical protein D3C85_1616190 [compost metagenome]
MDFHWHEDTSRVELFADYSMGRDRGIVQAYLDGISIGDPINQYCEAETSLPVTRIYLGQVTLLKGKHVLSFKVVGKDEASSGYSIGLHHAVRIERVC